MSPRAQPVRRLINPAAKAGRLARHPPAAYEDLMTDKDTNPQARDLPPAAQRALAEAAARRRLADEADAGRQTEIHGRGGAEPVRFGDWEVKGLATDF